MTRRLIVPLLALLAFGCKGKAPAHRMGTSVNIAPTGIFQVIPATMDPNTANLPGAVGTRVQNAGGANAWDKGSDGTWHAVTSGGGGLSTVTTDGVTIGGDGSLGNPVAGLPSSASNAGTMSAANFSKVSTYDYDGWFAAQVALMKAAAPALTNYRPFFMDALPTPVALTTSNDGAVVGGGWSPPSASAWMFTRSIWQTPKTTSWAWSVRAILKHAVASINTVGYSNAANTHSVDLGSQTGVNSGTTYGLTINGAGTTTIDTGVTADSNPHVFSSAFDGTIVTVSIDGVQRGSTAVLTNLVDEPVFLYAWNTTTGNTIVERAAWGY